MRAPWDPLPLRESEWSRIPATRVEVDRLRHNGAMTSSGEPFVRVICWGGELFVVAGQQIVDRARERGESCVWAHVLWSSRRHAA